MSHRRSSGRFSLIQVDESDMYTLIHLYFTPGSALLIHPSAKISALLRYVRPVKLSLRFVAMFPVRLPSLAKESSAISAVCQLSSANSDYRSRRDASVSMKLRSGLTFFNSIRLSDLEYQ
jgi:hypothetical protein